MFTEKGSTTTESLVYPQHKNDFFVNNKAEKENDSAEEILALTCNHKSPIIYAAGNSCKIYVMEVQKNGMINLVGALEVEEIKRRVMKTPSPSLSWMSSFYSLHLKTSQLERGTA